MNAGARHGTPTGLTPLPKKPFAVEPGRVGPAIGRAAGDIVEAIELDTGYDEVMAGSRPQIIPVAGRAALGAFSGVALLPVAVLLGYDQVGEPLNRGEVIRFLAVLAIVGACSGVASRRFAPKTLTGLAGCYVAVLLAIVTCLLFRPFSKLLTLLLLGWMGLFFLFALVVFASCIVLPLVPLYREFRDWDAGERPSPRSSGVWDRELDG